MAKIKKNYENKIKKTLMYIGPTLKNEGLSSGTIICGEFDKRLQGIIEKYPSAKHLFVPVDKNLAILKNNLSEKGTLENIMYKKTLELLGGRK